MNTHFLHAAFQSNLHDRNAGLRANETALTALYNSPESDILPVWKMKPLFDQNTARLVFVKSDHEILKNTPPPIYLGVREARHVFAVDVNSNSDIIATEHEGFVDLGDAHHPSLSPDTAFLDLRAQIGALNDHDGSLAVTARAMLAWHEAYRYCPSCATPLDRYEGGWRLECPNCGKPQFPRCDAVAIVLVTDGDRVLLGRGHGWPETMYSLLAGFVEPGETIEAAARREVFEESGVKIGDVTLLESQPWPFPSSLMVACKAQALETEIKIDPNELADARWVSRIELIEHDTNIKLARKGAIAHKILNEWLLKQV